MTIDTQRVLTPAEAKLVREIQTCRDLYARLHREGRLHAADHWSRVHGHLMRDLHARAARS